jgi:sugar phosphate isomerase/epimerase
VRLPNRDDFHLTYCTNIHPANGWDAVFANLKHYAPQLKARFSPGALDGDRLQAFRTFLSDKGLYVALINGFPHGAFHGTVVKAEVYAPDWRAEARVRYTEDLIEILRRLLPPGAEGGISTAPLSYKAWMADDDSNGWDTVIRHVVRIAEALVRVKQADRKTIHLDIEPEPDCCLETTDETLAFFSDRLLPRGAPILASSLGIGQDEARERLLEHIQICFDCCHFAVEYEDAARAIERLGRAGIRIGRVQLSSALRVHFPDAVAAAAETAERLKPFADAVYLHQVVEDGTGALRRYPDLPEALSRAAEAASKEWRIHFHVPLFTKRYDRFDSTQDYVRDVLDTMVRTGATRHLEIETYTWDVLPAGLKGDLLESIAREYEWVLSTLAGPA